MIYNIVNSVKGGCGKSTFSILLALGLHEKWYNNRLKAYAEANSKPVDSDKDVQNEPGEGAYPSKEAIPDKEGTKDGDSEVAQPISEKLLEQTDVCLVDVDTQGTAMQYLLFGTNCKLAADGRYLNDKVSSLSGDNQKCVVNCTWKKRRSDGASGKDMESDLSRQFDLVLCDPRQDAKDRFRAISNQNYTPEIQYSTFREGLKNLLQSLGRQNPYSYGQVIFDMPPNSDGYSDAVLDLLLNKAYSVMKKKDISNMFLIQSLDRGQCSATMEYFTSMMEQENLSKADHIFLVYNETAKCQNENIIVNTIQREAARLNESLNLSEELKERIYFVTLRFVEKYYEICLTQDGITNQELNNENGNRITLPIMMIACLGHSDLVCNFSDYANLDEVKKKSTAENLFKIMEDIK